MLFYGLPLVKECISFILMYYKELKLRYFLQTTLQKQVEVNLRPKVIWPVCLGVRLQSGAHNQIFVIGLKIDDFLIWSALSDKSCNLLI
jgi:hypothetical protein